MEGLLCMKWALFAKRAAMPVIYRHGSPFVRRKGCNGRFYSPYPSYAENPCNATFS
jgi:hypothetical protein